MKKAVIVLLLIGFWMLLSKIVSLWLTGGMGFEPSAFLSTISVTIGLFGTWFISLTLMDELQ